MGRDESLPRAIDLVQAHRSFRALLVLEVGLGSWDCLVVQLVERYGAPICPVQVLWRTRFVQGQSRKTGQKEKW